MKSTDKLIKSLNSKSLYAAVGPYSSLSIIPGNIYSTIHTSGIIGLCKKTNELVSSSTTEQADLCLKYLNDMMIEIGGSLESIAKVTLFIVDMNEFKDINEVYKKYFINHLPARTCVQVSRLPKDARFEIEAISYIKNEDILI